MTSKSCLSYRPCREDDIPFLAMLYATTRQAEMAQSGWPQVEIDAFLLSQFQFQHNYYQQHYKTAEFNIVVYDGQDIGRVYTSWEADRLRLIDIAFLPEYQGRGFGREILTGLINEAQIKNRDIFLYVESNNPAYDWYSRLGFVPCGENGVYQQMRWTPKDGMVKDRTANDKAATTQMMEVHS